LADHKQLLKVKCQSSPEPVISQLWSVTCHKRPHSVTCHLTQVNTPRLNPCQTGWYLFYYGGMEGWVDLGDWLHTKMVYLNTEGHTSTQPVVHYTTKPPAEQLTVYW